MLSKWVDLIFNLIRKELKVRYFGAFLGFFWALCNPLITFGLYYFVFTRIYPSAIPNYALYLVTGILHWAIFNQVLTQGTSYLLDNAGLIKKINFPRLVVPIAGILTNLVFWLMSLGVYFVLFVPLGGAWHLSLLVYPFLLLFYIIFMWGIALVLSVLQVMFRDIKYMLEVLLPLFFWLTPIVWRFEQVPSAVLPWLKLNPIAWFFQSFYQTLVWGIIPEFSLFSSLFAAAVVSLVFGLWVFQKYARRVTQWL